MRDLSTMELTDIQGGNMVGRLLNIAGNIVTIGSGIIDLTQLVVQKGDTPNYDNFNQMGDYSG
jgi:hypothetical protein